MKPSHHSSLEHLFHATKWSWQGLKAAWQHEQSFRIEVVASFGIIPLAFYLGETPVECVLLLTTWMLVLVVELLNSGIEATIDRISTEHHELSERAKDLGSAAVFLCNIMWISTWFLILVS